jgi:hypothetical protein
MLILGRLDDIVFNSGQSDKAFHQWRSYTSTLLLSYARENEVVTHAQLILKDIEDKLRYILKNWQSGLKVRLQKIIMDAIRLDADLSQQQAWWYCEYPGVRREPEPQRYDILFMPQSMKAAQNGECSMQATHAILMISPALMKAGNSRGEEYDRGQVVAESVVICGRPRLPQVHRSHSTGSPTGSPYRSSPREQRRSGRDKEKLKSEQGLRTWFLQNVGI